MRAVDTPITPVPEAAPSARVIVERPPPGLARGNYAAPSWLIVLFGCVLAVFGAAYVFSRWRRLRQK
jgi:hypothetical protein